MIEVLECEIESLSIVYPELEYEYVLGQGPQIFPVSSYAQRPNCGYLPVTILAELEEPNTHITAEDYSFETFGMIISLDTDRNEFLGYTTVVLRITTVFDSG